MINEEPVLIDRLSSLVEARENGRPRPGVITDRSFFPDLLRKHGSNIQSEKYTILNYSKGFKPRPEIEYRSAANFSSEVGSVTELKDTNDVYLITHIHILSRMYVSSFNCSCPKLYWIWATVDEGQSALPLRS